MSPRRSGVSIRLTDRALRDIGEIETYSIAEWGRRVASRYLSDIEAALLRLAESPALLRPVPELHPELGFYRVNKHLLVGDRQSDSIVVLTVISAARDIPSRLAELEPGLVAEVELLHRHLRKQRRK